MNTLSGFAIVPDGSELPVALFTDLEQALEWALEHVGSGKFVVRYLVMAAQTAAERVVS